MKILSRDFSLAERILLIFLALLLIGLAYYRFVDQPVRTALKSAESERNAVQLELDAVSKQVSRLEKMQNDLDEMKGATDQSRMASYNNSKEELALLNDALRSANAYAVTFDDVTREGNQIRRNFSLQFSAPNYETAKAILSQIAISPYRCLIGDMTGTTGSRNNSSVLTVSATATFYETMVGGTPDAGLPADTSSEPEEASSFDSAVVGAEGANAEVQF